MISKTTNRRLPEDQVERGYAAQTPDLTAYEKRVGGRLVAKFLARSQDAEAIDRLLHQLCRACGPGGNSRPVFVCDVLDQEKYDERVRTKGAKPLTTRTFASGKAASAHFGYDWPAVQQALNRAKQRGQDVAEVAGLQVCWLDEMPGL